MDEKEARINKFFAREETRDLITRIRKKSMLIYPHSKVSDENVKDSLMITCLTPFDYAHRRELTKKDYDGLITATKTLKNRLKMAGIDVVVGRTLEESPRGLWATAAIDDVLQWLSRRKVESENVTRTRVSSLDKDPEETVESARLRKSELTNFIGAIFAKIEYYGFRGEEALEIVKYFFKQLYPMEWSNLDNNRNTFIKIHCGLLTKKP